MSRVITEIAYIAKFTYLRETYEITIVRGDVVKMIWQGGEVPAHNVYSHGEAIMNALTLINESIDK